MKSSGRPRHKKEGIFAVVVVLFFVVIFFYLRFIIQHAEVIRNRWESKHQRQHPHDDAEDEKRLVAEDEVEGGLGAEWGLLQQKLRNRSKHVASPAPMMADSAVVPEGHTALPVTAESATENPTVLQARGKWATTVPTSLTSSVTHPQRRAAVSPTTAIPPATSAAVRVVPLPDSDRSFVGALAPPSPPSDLAENKILALYDNVIEFDGDVRFFQEHAAIFDHVPHARALLRRWQTLNRNMRTGKTARRFVLVHPVGQLCNRLMAITSAALVAIVTKRGLIVDDAGFYAQSADLFEEPGFAWTTMEPAIDAGGHLITNPESGMWEETEPLLCQDLNMHYHTDHLEVSINQYLVPYLENNPHYRRDLLAIFRGDTFHVLSQFLFRPIASIRAMRDSFVRDHFAGRFVVGLQVRSGGDFTDHFMSSDDWKLYRECAEALVPQRSRSELVIFLATDTEQGRAAGAAAFASVDDHNRSHAVLVSTPRFLLSNNPEGVQMALLDLLLLAAADDRVTTAWSSYGYFAAGFSGVHSAMVVDKVPEYRVIAAPGEEQRFMGIPHKSDKRKQCVRLPTHQPCFHKFESWGASKTSCFSRAMFEREMLNGRYC